MKLVLASSSPRRQELLRALGLDFEVLPSELDERLEEQLPPDQMVETLAAMKAQEVLSIRPDAVVLGADTVVSIGGHILGKPSGKLEAARMLRQLSGRVHEVYTGVALLSNRHTEHFCEKTRVRFYELSNDLIERYLATGEPFDKAGAYGIQAYGSVLVKGIEGDYFNVMGLPVARVARSLESFGIRAF